MSHEEAVLAAAKSWGLELDEKKVGLLRLYAGHVLEKNRLFNITSVSGISEIWQRHLADSLACVPVLRELLAGKPCPEIADAGSGAGYLGICVKIAWPEAQVALWESNLKKFQFLSWATAALGLKGITAVRARLGEKKVLPAEAADAVVERAMGRLPEILEACLGLAKKEGGIFAAYQSGWEKESPQVDAILGRMDSRVEKTVKYVLPDEKKERAIVVFRRNR